MKIVSKLLVVLCIPLCLSCEVKAQQRVDIYVATTGSDVNPGTINAPFATLKKAQAAVRNIVRNQTNKAVTVWLAGGNYPVTASTNFTAEDSGDTTNTITYRPKANALVTLSAVKVIPSSQWKPLNAAATKRVHPKVDATKLVQLDVNTAGLVHAKQFAPMNQFEDKWYIIDLFADSKRQPLAQWPNHDQNIRNLNDAGWVSTNGAKDSYTFHYAAGGKPEDGDTVNEIDLDGTKRSARWRAALDAGHEVWLKGFWRVPWGPLTSKVQSIDLATKTISLMEAPPGGMGSKYSAVGGNNPLWRVGLGKEKWLALNLLEEIDAPGEWALDTKDGMIYYYPPKPVNELELTVADFAEPIIQFNKANNIQVIGISFSGTLGNAVEVIKSNNIKLAGCNISNVGNTGIMVKGGNKVILQSNNIFQTGGSGIEVTAQGNRPQLLATRSKLVNNHVHHIGNLSYKEAIVLKECVGLTIAHNLIHDVPKSAIRTDLVNNCLFEFNEVHNIALKESDNGAFYNYGGWSTYGNIFRYNLVHHINRSNAFYCDDGDSGDLFYNNIVVDCIDAVKFGGGHDNIARNNLFVKSQAQGIDERGITRNYALGTDYEKRLQAMRPFAEPWKRYGETLKKQYGLKHDLWSDIFKAGWHPEYPNGCAMVDNIAVASGSFSKPEHGEVTVTGNVALTKVADAGFYNYRLLDLRTNNKQVLKKFPNLNKVVPLIGLIKDEYRHKIPARKATGGLANRAQAGSAWDEDQFVD